MDSKAAAQALPARAEKPRKKHMNDSNNILLAKTGKIDGEPVFCITLEKAGIYRGKQRYTVNELPDLGATVSPEVEVARWLLVRGADPADQMAVRYPKGQGFPLELQFQGKPHIMLMNPNVTTLADAAHLYDTGGDLFRPQKLVSQEEYAAMLDASAATPFSQLLADQELAIRCNDKIGTETRKRLKREAGIVLDDYPMRWRNERAAELLEDAAKWEDGRKCRRPDDIWKDTKHLDKAAYGAAMAAKLRWQAARELAGERITREEAMAKDHEGNLMRLPLRAWIQRRIDRGATLIEACRVRIKHEAAIEARKEAAKEAEQVANAAAWEFFNTEREKARQGLPSAIKLGQTSFLFGGKWRSCHDRWTWRDYALAANADPMEYIQDVGATPADLDTEFGAKNDESDFAESHADDESDFGEGHE
jgi:hypothetical protein